MLKRQPTLKGFLNCWTCDQTFADFDLVVSASPCVVRCRGCAAEAQQMAEFRRRWAGAASQPARGEVMEAA